MDQLLKAQAFAQLDEKRNLHLLTSIPQMGAARGWTFEA